MYPIKYVPKLPTILGTHIIRERRRWVRNFRERDYHTGFIINTIHSLAPVKQDEVKMRHTSTKYNVLLKTIMLVNSCIVHLGVRLCTCRRHDSVGQDHVHV